MKKLPVLTIVCHLLLLFSLCAPVALAGFAAGTEPTLEPDTSEPMLSETGEFFNGIGYTYPMMPDEFYVGLAEQIEAVEAQGAAAFTAGNTIALISNYSPSLSEYTGEHQLLLSNLTHNFATEAETVGLAHTDSMAQAYEDINTSTDTFFDPSSGFPAAHSTEAAAARNLILTYTDETETTFDAQIAVQHAAVQTAKTELDTALAGYAALNPADLTPANQAAVASARAAVELATDNYTQAYSAELAYRTEQSELSARSYRESTENSFTGYSSEIQNSVDNTPSSGMLINEVIGGLATTTAGHPYFDPDNPLDDIEAYSRTPGERNVAAYDVARRVYDDLETGLQTLRQEVGDTAQEIAQGRSQYRLFDSSLDTMDFDDAARRTNEDFVDTATQRGQLFSQDMRGLADQYGNGTIVGGTNFLNQADDLRTTFHLDQTTALGRAQTTFLDHVDVYKDVTAGKADDFKTDLADLATDALGRAPELRSFITERMQEYLDDTHENVVDLVDDVVYESLVDLEVKIVSGEVSSFDFSSLNSPNLENGEFKHFFFDPAVAVGYQFDILFGPNFRSVSFQPVSGDDLFDLYLFSNNAWIFDRNLTAGTDANGDLFEHILNLSSPDLGVSQFRILGIAPEAMLDPGDPFAFAAGLSFTGNLVNAQIRMTPLTQNYTPAGATVVPEPTTLLLLGTGLLGLLIRKR
ncbi:MAG: PEP-CTERM sorting domain-containing protein [Candidatus Omnitrophica bacterium]|nr:PEP-CTERM sorting domain-containing protein [Candidatus Omnitrophota bacterium]MDD5672149.1 PEP-CTERM sorting domain-containing protein [Candidatus Omnitrophota bacterium]